MVQPTAQPAFITVLAAPSAATYTQGVEDVGPIFADIWDEAALVDLPVNIDLSVANYPVLGAQAGFSHATLPFRLKFLVFLWTPNIYYCLRANS
jgi:hypothetical protein